MNCENCSIQHDGKYGRGRFCSRKCASAFSSNKNKNLKNKKISDSLKGKYTGIDNSFYKSGKSEGSGLGLYLAKKIIELYNGKITVNDSKMGGAKFSVYLEKL